MTVTANTRIQGTNPATGRAKYAAGTGEIVRFEEKGHHGTVAVVRWTNGVETHHCRDLDDVTDSDVTGLEFPTQDADAELLGFVRTVAATPLPLPMTETDVAAAGVMGVVQFGRRLVWAKLISVTNRRTRFSPTILATVEFEGVRRLVKADHFLAA